MSNLIMLLGNHEYMMLQYLNPDETSMDIRSWNRNGNVQILKAFLKQKEKVQQRIRTYLRTRPPYLELENNGNRFYMVHGSLVIMSTMKCGQGRFTSHVVLSTWITVAVAICQSGHCMLATSSYVGILYIDMKIHADGV